MFEQDYIQRLIKAMSKMAVALVMGKDAIKENIEEDNYDMKLSEDDMLEIMVKKYMDDGNINEAENIIFEALKKNPTKRIHEIAMDFYNHINEYSDEKLLELNFSREEIINGLKETEIIIKRACTENNTVIMI